MPGESPTHRRAQPRHDLPIVRVLYRQTTPARLAANAATPPHPPRLDLWVDVTVHERDGRYIATADLGEDWRDVGVG